MSAIEVGAAPRPTGAMRADALSGASSQPSTKDEQTSHGGAGFASLEALEAAWHGLLGRQSERGKAPAVGVDGVRAGTFAARLELNLREIHRVLSRRGPDGRTAYVFAPWVSRTLGPADGRKRWVYIPRLRDQLVLRLVAEALSSAMARRGLARGPPSQARCARFLRRELGKEGTWFLRADIQRFYESAPRAEALAALRALGLHPDVECLVERMFATPARGPFSRKGSELPLEGGYPAGLSVSSLLGELVLARLDEALARTGVRHLRYVDDLFVVGDTEEEVRHAEEVLVAELGKLGLWLSSSKVSRGTLRGGVHFLGLETGEDGVRVAAGRVQRWLAGRQRDIRGMLAASAGLGREGQLDALEALVADFNAELSGARGRLLPVAGAAGDSASLAELDRVLRLMLGGVFRRLDVKPTGRFRLVRAETWGHKWRRSPRRARAESGRLFGGEGTRL